MTAPMSLREYFAASGSQFSKRDAEIIGPQIESMAEDGSLDVKDEAAAKRTLVDTAQSPNSPLHPFFPWDDKVAADLHRLHVAGTMLRSIRVRFVKDDRPRTLPAYKIARQEPKSVFGRGHNVLHGSSAIAVRKAREAFDEITSWRARYQPFVIVWTDFAQVFQGVANQISEAEEAVRAHAIEDSTDAALTEMNAILAACRAWQGKHGPTVPTWVALAEQAGFMIEAIETAATAFTREKPMERLCLGCSKPFQSAGVGNRMCERCGKASGLVRVKLG